jgi:hypothetical protein
MLCCFQLSAASLLGVYGIHMAANGRPYLEFKVNLLQIGPQKEQLLQGMQSTDVRTCGVRSLPAGTASA